MRIWHQSFTVLDDVPHYTSAIQRHFARVAELMLVAAQEGDRIDVLRWDGMHLGTAADPVPAPSVTCIAPRP